MLNISDYFLSSDSTLIEAVEKLNSSIIDIILVVDDKENLLGVITDGDIRKAILLGYSHDEKITKHMNSSPVILTNTDLKEAFALSYATNLSSIPVIKDNKIIGLFIRHFKNFITHEESQISQEKIDKSTVALIMAGGEGKRLRPYTENIPKSLAKIGNTTLIERNIQILAQSGIQKVYIAVNYLSDQIINKLGDGSKFGIEISYLKEKEKLGTAGPINLIRSKNFKHLIVLNADIVCNLQYTKLDIFHSNQKNDLTVVCSKNYIPIDYGVISANSEFEITGIKEKPIKEFWCAAGIYIFSKNALFDSLSKKNSYVDMPDLITSFLKNGYKTKAFPLMPIHEKWFDVADINDLKQINTQDWPQDYKKK